MDGQTSTVTTPDGRRLGVCVWGDPDGAPLFWLHGTPGSRFLREPDDSYVRHHLRVYTYDRPGYGLSTRLPGRRAAGTAADVRAIADAFGLDEFGVAGVSGGGPSALAAAALLPERVRRCAVVAGLAPFSSEGLDFFAGMDEEGQQGWQLNLQGASALESDWQEVLAWVKAGLPDLNLSDAEHAMLIETMIEATRQGSGGYIDDSLSFVDDWGFALEEVRVPTRIMVARDDTSVPAAHGEWLVGHLPAAELITVDGGHFGPRHDPEMELLTWVGHGDASYSPRSRRNSGL
ncbi:pimeloyl-ACP methyl ester carboxylesterase [Kribbella antiqua]|uniref:Pimeloyl-ACP methyl ester carboxylesterase n=1 Tax=Kribbella antiqua TaxID=2512217 RepID=A0A4R2I4V2_9ACTN|nr:alpha/beta hydrolase [Kribbella antiqua]TCO38128.1 pimeloyl-ACP methyl ester carboxylesterase [Kribbella antiqua]